MAEMAEMAEIVGTLVIPMSLINPRNRRSLLPSAPRSTAATPDVGEMMLMWQPPSDDGGSPITGYEYRQRRENEKFDDTWLPVDGGGSVRKITITGLENGVTYLYQVRAVNAAGKGDPSKEFGAATLKPVVTLVAAAPSIEEGEDAVFVLKRTGRVTTTLSVSVSVTESGNVLVDGYQAPAQLTFPAGEQETRLAIATEDDTHDETDGTLIADSGGRG